MIVVDTNVIAYAVIPGDKTSAALELLQREADWRAPRLWRSELRNVLATTMRVAGMELASALAVFAHAQSIVREIDLSDSTEEILGLARAEGISAYDAEFVIAARRSETRLITADRKLALALPEWTTSLEQAVAGL